MACFMWIDADGAQNFGEGDAIPDGAIAVSRLPGPFEAWDADAGAFVHDAAAEADALAGPLHIAAMHARKAIEARLVLAGIAEPGMLLVREAELRGVSAAELAAIVIDKAAAAEALELERQAASLRPSE